MVRLLARVIGIGIETADLLVHEVLLRSMRDRRAVGRYGGLTGSPERSGSMSREKGLARSGNARVRRAMVQLAWRFLLFQKNSSLAQWYRQRTGNAPKTRKTMIVALARKLLIALWRLAREGVVPEGVVSARLKKLEPRLVYSRFDPLDLNGSPMTIRGGGTRRNPGSHAVVQNGPAASGPRR